MPGMYKKMKTPKKLTGRTPKAKMSGKGMPSPRRPSGGASMPSKGR